MREEHPIEVAISLFWNASIYFIFLPRIEVEMPLPRIPRILQIEFAG